MTVSILSKARYMLLVDAYAIELRRPLLAESRHFQRVSSLGSGPGDSGVRRVISAAQPLPWTSRFVTNPIRAWLPQLVKSGGRFGPLNRAIMSSWVPVFRTVDGHPAGVPPPLSTVDAYRSANPEMTYRIGQPPAKFTRT